MLKDRTDVLWLGLKLVAFWSELSILSQTPGTYGLVVEPQLV